MQCELVRGGLCCGKNVNEIVQLWDYKENPSSLLVWHLGCSCHICPTDANQYHECKMSCNFVANNTRTNLSNLMFSN